MIDPFENPFGPPAKRAAPADPFGTMPFEDRWRLASGKILGTNLGRRLLGLPDREPGFATDRSPRQPVETASGTSAGGYEAIPGWRVPLDADLKALGLEALDNARRAGERAERQPGPARQVRTAERLRRTAGSRPAGGNPAAGEQTARNAPRPASSPVRRPAPQPLRSGRSATGTEGVFGIGRSAGLPKAKPGTAPESAKARQRQPEQSGRPPLTGLAAGLLPAHWRALAGGLLQAREAIKQASIAAERKHGDDRQAHDAEVAVVARQEDAGLPGFTGHATVLSAQRAGGKYRKNLEHRVSAAGDPYEAAPRRATADTLAREGRHALGKAERALDAGDRRAAERHRRDAWLILTNAKAAEIEALEAGSVPAESPAPDSDGDDERDASERNASGKDSAVAPVPDGPPAKGPAPAKEDEPAGSQKPDHPADRPADREAPAEFDRKDVLARLERQFIDGPGPLGATVNRRILAAATAAHASAEARDAAVRDAIRRAWRGKPAMQRKLIAAAKAAAAGKTAAERKRLFLEAAAGTTVERTLGELRKAEKERVRRLNGERASAAFEAWRRANPDASEPERLNRAVDLALAYGAAPEALKTTVLRHIAQKRGVRRDRHGKMTVADAGATWEVYAALGRLYRRDPETAKALFPGIHGFVAESVAQNRFGWDAAERDPAARIDILKRVYLDAEKMSVEKHKHGLYILPWVGPILAAPEAFGAGAKLAGHMHRGEWDRIDAAEFASVFAPLLGGGAGAVRSAQQWLRRKKAATAKQRSGSARDAGSPAAGRDRGTPRDPDGDVPGIDWSGRESTERFFDDIAGNARWFEKRAENTNIPTFGGGAHSRGEGNIGARIDYGDGRPGASVGEVRLYRENGKSYAIRPDGERVDIGRLPRNATRTEDGGWEAKGVAPDGTEVKVYYNPHGLPEFPASGAFWLPPEVVRKSPGRRRAYVRTRLREMARNNSEELEKMGFTAEQIKNIKNGVNPRELGIRIHHDYRVGRMLIVDEHIHRIAHQGGGSLW